MKTADGRTVSIAVTDIDVFEFAENFMNGNKTHAVESLFAAAENSAELAYLAIALSEAVGAESLKRFLLAIA